jgi:hypothetical protein
MHIVINIYNDFWLDNGVENFYRIVKRLDDSDQVVKNELTPTSLFVEIIDRERFIDLLREQITDGLANVIFVEKKDEKTGEIRNVRKDFVLAQYGSKENGRNVLKEKILYPPEIKKRLDEIFAGHKKEDRTCVLCSRVFGRNIEALRQVVYPPVTKIASLTGVRRQQENYKDLCPICYLVGTLEWMDRGMIYRTFPGEGASIVFFPMASNLIDLNRMKERYIQILLNNTQRYCNIKVAPDSAEVEKTSGEFNTLLCFYEKLIYTGVEFDPETDLKRELCTEWNCLRIPLGTVKNIRVDHIALKLDILRAILRLAKNDKWLYKDCLKKVFFRKRTKRRLETDWDETNLIVEELSRSFLEDDFLNFARQFLPHKQGFLQISKSASEILDSLIIEWRCSMTQGNAAIVPEDLETIRGAGNIVGKISQNHVNILFKIDKARTPLEFTDALREAARRMYALDYKTYYKDHTFAPSKLEELIELFKHKEDNWKEIRNLLILYSCVNLSKEKMKGGDKQTTSEVKA